MSLLDGLFAFSPYGILIISLVYMTRKMESNFLDQRCRLERIAEELAFQKMEAIKLHARATELRQPVKIGKVVDSGRQIPERVKLTSPPPPPPRSFQFGRGKQTLAESVDEANNAVRDIQRIIAEPILNLLANLLNEAPPVNNYPLTDLPNPDYPLPPPDLLMGESKSAKRLVPARPVSQPSKRC